MNVTVHLTLSTPLLSCDMSATAMITADSVPSVVVFQSFKAQESLVAFLPSRQLVYHRSRPCVVA